MDSTAKKAMDWLDNQIRLRKELCRTADFSDLRIEVIDIRTPDTKEIHIVGVRALAKALNHPCIKKIWQGNKQCNSNWIELYVYYKGYKVFELTDRSNWEEK